MIHLQVICVLSVIAVVYAAQEPTAEEKAMMEECRKQVNATPEDVKALDDEIIPSTRPRLCMTACYYKKTGVLDAQNNINIDKVLAELADLKEENDPIYEKISNILKECHKKYTPIKDECDSIKSYFDCTVKAIKEAGIPLEK